MIRGPTPWENDELQFARLLCEIVATQEDLDIDELCASMDLAPGEIHELLDRAHEVWEKAKTKAWKKARGDR